MKSKSSLLLACLLLPVHFVVAADTNSPSAAHPFPGGIITFAGKVTSTTNAAGYTYVQVDTSSNKLWAATTQFPVKAGDTVTVYDGVPMKEYHSKSMNRDFDLVYFTGRISVEGGASSMPAISAKHPPIMTPPPAPSVNVAGIKRAEGGKTIQEIFAGKAALAGTPVTVRGKVVKYSERILGKNWLHIQDGSGTAAAYDNDLAVTTGTSAAVGDTVLVTGNVSTNRDFGAGYKYSVIIEDARVTVEK